MRYSENHHLNSDDGGTNVHVALHLQGASLLRAMEFVDVVLAAAGEYVLEAEAPAPLQGATVLRPQTSGPCVHIDQADDEDPKEIQALGLACRHPGRVYQRDGECPQEWECPHMDAPDILCSVRDACYAMREVIRMREAGERERGIPVISEQTGEVVCYTPRPIRGPPPEADAVPRSDYLLAPPAPPEPAADTGRLHTYAVEPEPERVPSYEATAVWGEIKSRYPEEEPVYETKPVQAPRSPRKDTWTAEEDVPIRAAEHAAAAVEAYRAAFPESIRTEKAIRKRYKNVYVRAVAPAKGQAPPHVREWTGPEQVAVAFATSPADAVRRYRAAFPDSDRSDGAIRARYYTRTKADREAASTPDFVGDTVPVTQCEEPSGKGFYGDTRALHADLMDGMMCDRPLSEGTIAVGDKVVRRNGPAGVGEVLFVGKGGMHVSVQFPGSIVSHVYGVGELRRVEE